LRKGFLRKKLIVQGYNIHLDKLCDTSQEAKWRDYCSKETDPQFSLQMIIGPEPSKDVKSLFKTIIKMERRKEPILEHIEFIDLPNNILGPTKTEIEEFNKGFSKYLMELACPEPIPDNDDPLADPNRTILTIYTDKNKYPNI